MKNNWFCPNCGQPMEAQRHVDNPTGRITWTIGCLNPKHFHTRGYMNAAIAEIQLEKLLHHSSQSRSCITKVRRPGV